MMLSRRTALMAGIGLAAPLAAPRVVRAQPWPGRAIRVTVPYSPGGGTDVFTRVLAEGLHGVLGQSLIIENRIGANGVVGSQAVSRAEPDGYNLAVVTNTHTMNRYAMPSVPFDAVADFTPITLLSRFPMVLAVSGTTGVRDLPGLIAYGKANPGRLSFGSSEAATSYAGNEFARQAGLKMEEIAYRGGAPLMNDVVAGNLPVGWTSILSAGPYFTNERVRILAVTTRDRSALLPDVPSVREAGLPDYEFAGWYGMLGPAGLSPQIAETMNAAIVKAMAIPQYETRFRELGADMKTLGPRDFAAHLRAENSRWNEAAKAGLIKPLQ
ncbi:Bug family tripartite tricarboxylate transporter substrate binding protein [Pseudoroseomonas globiformis]|uniref:Bug family tripartite tricarboxylate transporter substrate binding protein n=1 Tax=Teichococcus globiformis TaxID=2307229 RepID=A0ABV7FYK9_9PROT